MLAKLKGPRNIKLTVPGPIIILRLLTMFEYIEWISCGVAQGNTENILFYKGGRIKQHSAEYLSAALFKYYH